MWCYLEPWIVQDGQLPNISVGTVLANVGVSIRGGLLSDVQPEAGVRALVREQGSTGAAYRYRVSGIASAAHDVHTVMDAAEALNPKRVFAEFALTCGPLLLCAQAIGVRARQIAEERIVSLDGIFSVMAGHEFYYDDADAQIQRNWSVVGIQVQRYEMVWRKVDGPDGAGWEGVGGTALDLHVIDHIDVARDRQRYATEHFPGVDRSTDFIYILDLEPVT